jgi:hypothetical protein
MDSNEMRELGVVKIAAPCPADWSRMEGTARVRFCKLCKLNVYNIEELTADEARALIRENEGQRLCVRLWLRTDGTVITKDCPRGLQLRRRWKRARAGAGVFAALAIVCGQLFAENIRTLFNMSGGLAADPPPRPPEHIMGKTMKNFGQNNTSQY